jgi:ATP-dependent DNA ligase
VLSLQALPYTYTHSAAPVTQSACALAFLGGHDPVGSDVSSLIRNRAARGRGRWPKDVPPCLPTKAQEPPSEPTWLHEIKHDGFPVIARKDGSRVRLYSRPGNDLTDRFRLIVEALVCET